MLKATVISQGFTFKGDIIGDGALNVDGIFSGRIQVNSINISATGGVEGEIAARSIVVKGQMVGVVECVDLTIAANAKVEGRISYESIQIERGGVFRGEIVKKPVQSNKESN